jgi:uncharacterized protein YwgA
MKEFQARTRGYLGRTAVQKLCHFAKVLGVPFSYRFQIHYYGPYSEELSSAVDRLLANGALQDGSRDQERYSSFRLGPEASQVLDEHASTLRRFEPTVTRVVEAFGSLEPKTLELLSTLHFTAQRLKASGNARPEREDVLGEFRKIKGDKFSETEIDRAFNAMEKAGLLK